MSIRLAPGDQAPEFLLPDDAGNQVSLSDFHGRTLVLFAFPAAMTPGCTTEACDFQDSLASLGAAGFSVVGISPDKPQKLAKFRAKEHLEFPLLSDPDKQVLAEYGAFGEKSMYGKKTMGVIRSTFIIDGRGTITHALYNVKAKGHVARVRSLLAV